jgi:hypothetical protein
MFSGTTSSLQGTENELELFEEHEHVDLAALTALDAAASSPAFDNAILSSSPARDIRTTAEQLIALLESIDLHRLMRKQGLLGRLTGADVEARLVFELASQRVLEMFRKLGKDARAGTRVLDLLADTKLAIANEQLRFEAVINGARSLLRRTKGADQSVVARYERRLSNIMALEASNSLTIQQIELSTMVLASLLDRVTDIETLLLPIWQRNALAIIHGDFSGSRGAIMTTFLDAHDNLIGFLKKVGPV